MTIDSISDTLSPVCRVAGWPCLRISEQLSRPGATHSSSSSIRVRVFVTVDVYRQIIMTVRTLICVYVYLAFTVVVIAVKGDFKLME